MKTLPAFFRLIRFPNLFFIALTQVLFYTCIVYSLEYDHEKSILFLPHRLLPFIMLILASVFIAAAGYIINDYFDLKIDSVNKPDKVVVDRQVKRRWAIMWHLVFSAAGVLLSAYVSYKTGVWLILPANIACVGLLWVYSTTFKKKLLSGNIMIAGLTAWTVLVVYFFAGASFLDVDGWHEASYAYDIRKLFKITILYAGFAFIVSIIREVVKDLEDMNGDARHGCYTMPIAWGVPAAKVFAAVWIVVCAAALLIVQVYAWQLGWWQSAVYVLLAIVVPLVLLLKNLYQASVPEEYHRLSGMLKWIMLAGILSMAFFRMAH